MTDYGSDLAAALAGTGMEASARPCSNGAPAIRHHPPVVRGTLVPRSGFRIAGSHVNGVRSTDGEPETAKTG